MPPVREHSEQAFLSERHFLRYGDDKTSGSNMQEKPGQDEQDFHDAEGYHVCRKNADMIYRIYRIGKTFPALSRVGPRHNPYRRRCNPVNPVILSKSFLLSCNPVNPIVSSKSCQSLRGMRFRSFSPSFLRSGSGNPFIRDCSSSFSFSIWAFFLRTINRFALIFSKLL